MKLSKLFIKGEEIQESRLQKVKRLVKEETGLDLLTVSNRAIDEYRENTNKNKNIDYETAILKINRDYLVSQRITKDDDDERTVGYGNSKIVFNKHENKITRFINRKTSDPQLTYRRRCDWELKDKLDTIMGLN